jgi:hypothetical protein
MVIAHAASLRAAQRRGNPENAQGIASLRSQWGEVGFK